MPGDLDHVFFTNSGSEAVETALKIALAYHRVRGEGHAHAPDRARARLSRRRFRRHLGRRHGRQPQDVRRAAGRASIICRTPMTATEQAFSRGEPEWGAHLADELERLVPAARCLDHRGRHRRTDGRARPACCVPPKGYLKRLREICDKHGILLIFDEVITGFGRLGTPFAAELFRRRCPI